MRSRRAEACLCRRLQKNRRPRPSSSNLQWLILAWMHLLFANMQENKRTSPLPEKKKENTQLETSNCLVVLIWPMFLFQHFVFTAFRVSLNAPKPPWGVSNNQDFWKIYNNQSRSSPLPYPPHVFWCDVDVEAVDVQSPQLNAEPRGGHTPGCAWVTWVCLVGENFWFWLL